MTVPAITVGRKQSLALYPVSVVISVSKCKQEADCKCLTWGSGEGNGTPLQHSCLENPMGGGAWWAAVYGVTQSRTRLKRLSSSSNVKLIWSPASELRRLTLVTFL